MIGSEEVVTSDTNGIRAIAGAGELLAEHIARFRDYADRYLQDAGVADHRPVSLKIEHSLRVLENASAIIQAPSLLDAAGTPPGGGRAGLSFPTLIRLAALYHDVGRFEQYRRYATFHDKKSENHARLGVKVLRQSGLLAGLPDDVRSFIQAVVILHNRRFVPDGVAPDVRFATCVVRDADKVDIMRVMVEHFIAPDPADPVVTLHVAEHPTKYTESLYEAIMADKSGDYMAMRWTNDFKLLILGWVFQLNFRASLDMVRERRLAQQLLENLPDISPMRALGEKVRAALEPGAPAGGEKSA
ncbi:HD family phosphohydrolase [Oceanidesulfovibrio indonesiensis]|uniref:HD family phosphohydrolase n=1 Tax=Oceanidesulfovibrio indonesiensis TaxID=54767 RepID=A0A7M3MKE3_9BACT|nr:HD family phosphohydrolase [Oceanidesulfovibrio indonesiensis]